MASPDFFDRPTLNEAKKLILDYNGPASEERWVQETEWLCQRLSVSPGHLLDFGCGVGRIAKCLASADTPVTGVDSSPNMREFARDYVASPYFNPVSPEELDTLLDYNVKFNSGISIWVLQHVMDPGREIARLSRALVPNAPLYICNLYWRAIPINWDKDVPVWGDDGINIMELLATDFELMYAEKMPKALVTSNVYFAKYIRRGC